jgi:hypothetical protein
MPAVPSIKGSVFTSVIEDVAKLLHGGALSREEAARWTQPQDLALLDQEIVVSGWYDLGSYTRLTELLRDVEGGGDNEYLRERGRRTARRLLDAGLYAQFEYLQRVQVRQATDERARFEAFGRDLRLLTSISGSILNFSRWTSRPDPEQAGRYLIEVLEARDFPEILCWTSDGFMNGMAGIYDARDMWTWRRPAPDRVVFSMTRVP